MLQSEPCSNGIHAPMRVGAPGSARLRPGMRAPGNPPVTRGRPTPQAQAAQGEMLHLRHAAVGCPGGGDGGREAVAVDAQQLQRQPGPGGRQSSLHAPPPNQEADSMRATHLCMHMGGTRTNDRDRQARVCVGMHILMCTIHRTACTC